MSRPPWRRQLLVPILSALLALAALLAIPNLFSKFAVSAMQADGHLHHDAPMSEAEMKRWVEDWFSKHPEVGRSTSTTAAADTFFVGNFFFNSDGNTGTQVDTAKISIGESVRWRHSAGGHTVTDGTPTAPTGVFDVAMSSPADDFEHIYEEAGTFPFFCRPHSGSNMRGIVVVRQTVGVGPGDGVALGFTTGPTPNPSSEGIRFHFALRTPGRVRAEILDVRGRRIATIIDDHLESGVFRGAWNGRNERGASAGAGAYYLRLRIPSFEGTRRFVVTR
jgi:plastocyanin